MVSEDVPYMRARPLRILRLHLTNFLSYRSAVLELGDFVALVGPNSSGKSNAVAAIKLLREIPFHGLPTAISRRGGFHQLRHRSGGKNYDPSLRLDFQFDEHDESYYKIALQATSGSRYKVHEQAEIHSGSGSFRFTNSAGVYKWNDVLTANGEERSFSSEMLREAPAPVPAGQSVVSLGPNYGPYLVSDVLQSMQTVEINPASVGELQEPSSVHDLEPDGSNTASIYDNLPSETRKELIDELSAIVPGITRIAVRHIADKVTLTFYQEAPGKDTRGFLTKQMSDGTLRAFSILLSMLQPTLHALVVIEEPEIAIHLGALHTLIDILRQRSEKSQILITTHSADIIDTIDPQSLRVVWTAERSSHISRVAEHTIETIKKKLVTPGELLRSDALDPAGI